MHNRATIFYKAFMIKFIKIHKRTIQIHNEKPHSNGQKIHNKANLIHNQNNKFHKSKLTDVIHFNWWNVLQLML